MSSDEHKKDHINIQSFEFESDPVFPEVTVVYETWGTLNDARDNAVMIEHALTGSSHAASAPDDPAPGWWEYLIGPGCAIDTSRYFVICANVLGGCNGTTGPSSPSHTNGRPYGTDFPVVTVRDMVRSQKHVIDHLGIERLHTIIGGSMGGMQALEWAAMYPDSVNSIMCMAAPGRAYPQSIALRKAQRRAIMMDPDWCKGHYYGKSIPAAGIEVARMIGHITYRTEMEFAQRFGRDHHDDDLYALTSKFEIENYLEYQGTKLAARFDANTYLYLSKAMDLHDMGYRCESYEQGLQRIRAKTLVMGIDSDILFPTYQQKEIVDILKMTNNDVQYREITSIKGHDGFLVEQEQVTQLVRDYLEYLKGR